MIIGISGKIGSGKDLVGQIMQVLSCDAPDYINTDKIHDIKSVLNWLNSNEDTPWEEMMFPDHKVTKNFLSKHETVEIRKFADKLKDIVCLLIGCTREQLEDREFKEKELGEEWDFYEAGEWNKRFILATNIPYDETSYMGITKQKMTPRLMLQLLGTECGRQIIHPNIWVNALFADYKCPCNNCRPVECDSLANWIITDVRFPNEAQAIKDKGGIVIRVNRFSEEQKIALLKVRAGRLNNSLELALKDAHPSETALDNYKFDEVIENNGSIEELIEKVKKLNII